MHSLSTKEVTDRVDQYMLYYHSDRIQEKLGYQTPKKFGRLAASYRGVMRVPF
ncbi:hypothetical protein [Ornithinibacillus gellani]|uniref:hypothetical protein n=1 Tax=Ornithinibacillus gellani TaxID=2293253 RepID=UPI0037CAFB71